MEFNKSEDFNDLYQNILQENKSFISSELFNKNDSNNSSSK